MFPLEAPGDIVARAEISDDFEDGIDPRWQRSLENGDRCELTTETAASGTSSLRCQTDELSGSKASLVLAFEPTTALRVQMAVRFGPHTSQFLTFLTFVQTSHIGASTNRRLLTADYYPDRRIDVWNDLDGAFAYVAQPLAVDTWHRIDFRARISSTNGGVSVILDGGPSASIEDTDTTDLPITELQLGLALFGEGIVPMSVYLDDIVVSEE